MPWPTLVRKWFVASVGKPFSERPWRSSYPHLHLLCICLHAHHYHYFSCNFSSWNSPAAGRSIISSVIISQSPTHPRPIVHQQYILKFTWTHRPVRNIGTSITSSAATVEWESEETAKWGKISFFWELLIHFGKFWETLGKIVSISVSLPSPSLQVWQKEGRLYCDSDYKKKFVPRCADCSGFILGVISKISYMLYCIRALSHCCRSASGLLGRLGILNTFPAS